MHLYQSFVSADGLVGNLPKQVIFQTSTSEEVFCGISVALEVSDLGHLFGLGERGKIDCLGTASDREAVVERFGEIYELLESLTQRPDVMNEIEKWLRDKGGEGEH